MLIYEITMNNLEQTLDQRSGTQSSNNEIKEKLRNR